MFQRFSTWYGMQRDAVKALIVFPGTLIAVYVFFLITLLLVQQMGKGVMEPIYQSEQMLHKNMEEIKRPVFLPQEYFAVFKAQYGIMNIRKEHHLRLALIFFRNYYSVLILTMFISCIGGVTLFVMINKGWANAGITLQAFFLALVCAITYLGFFPLVFKQQENFSENMKYYENYTKAELGIYNQLASLQRPLLPHKIDTLDKANKVYRDQIDSAGFFNNIDSLIARNNATLSGLTNYVFTIDSKQLKGIGDVYRTIYNATTGKLDTTKVP